MEKLFLLKEDWSSSTTCNWHRIPHRNTQFRYCLYINMHGMNSTKYNSKANRVSWYIYIYVIHHWRIFRSSCRKLAWVGFEPTTTEFCSDALTDWAIRPWVQLALRANFVQLLQFHLFVQCSRFISVFAIVSRHICFKRSLSQVMMLVAEWIDTYGIHHWGIFRSSYRKLAWVGFKPLTTDIYIRTFTNEKIYQRCSTQKQNQDTPSPGT